MTPATSEQHDLAPDELIREVALRAGPGRLLVAVDGVDGSGKTRFAGGLRTRLELARPVVVIHLDDFLHPREVRHARGRNSPEGFWLDSYDYGAIRQWVLDPLGPRGDGWYRRATYDVHTEQAVESRPMKAPDDALVLIEGMFLHRDELASSWDASFFLDAAFAETTRRMASRDGTAPDPSHPTNRRYVEGQRLYFRACRPWRRATWVLDNGDPEFPTLIEGSDSFAARDSAG